MNNYITTKQFAKKLNVSITSVITYSRTINNFPKPIRFGKKDFKWSVVDVQNYIIDEQVKSKFNTSAKPKVEFKPQRLTANPAIKEFIANARRTCKEINISKNKLHEFYKDTSKFLVYFNEVFEGDRVVIKDHNYKEVRNDGRFVMMRFTTAILVDKFAVPKDIKIIYPYTE